MALELETKIMDEIGLGAHYSWFNGSGSCIYIAKSAVDKLAQTMQKHGLTLHPSWQNHCNKAVEVDRFDGEGYSLTNTWIACSYAIRDGMERKEGGKGYKPVEDWHFFYSEKKLRWQQSKSSGDSRTHPFMF